MNLIKETWTNKDYKKFIKYLFSLAEKKYKKFQQNIIPNKNIIGVRTKILKNIAKNITKGNYNEFLSIIENNYYEENMLYGLILTNIKDINILLEYLNKYILLIDNWSSCDLTISNLKIVKKHKELFLNYILKHINNNYPYTKRFCYVLLLNYYIEEQYIDTIFKLCNIENDDYYVNMAVAWLLSICYIKHKKITINFLNDNKLNKFTYNKTIQKIIESNQVDIKEKIILKQKKQKNTSLFIKNMIE